MRRATFLVFTGLTSNVAFAGEQILCTHAGESDVVIELQAKRQFNRILNCIHGDFIADMTPCAPNGGYGLSYPTGTAALSKVVDRWQDYSKHLGGVAQNYVNGHEIYFAGGFNSSDTGFHLFWSFSANRLDGSAVLKRPGDVAFSEPAKPDTRYFCKKVEPRF
jgi:hypothetical protein